MRLTHALITSLALGLTSVPAIAQDDAPPPRGQGGAGGPPGAGGGGGRGGQGGGRAGMPQLSPEQLKSAFEAQATTASTTAGLNADDTAKVVAAYQESRTSQSKAIEDLRAKLREAASAGGGGDEGGGNRRGQGAAEMQKATAEINKTEREKLLAALNAFLKPEQAEKVIEPLGAFNRQWDQVTVTVLDLKLDPAKQAQAMAVTQTYSAALVKAGEIEDMQARRDANTEARRAMNDEMKKILTEEEYTKFARAAGGGGRGGAGGGGPGGGGRGGQGGGGGGGGNAGGNTGG